MNLAYAVLYPAQRQQLISQLAVEEVLGPLIIGAHLDHIILQAGCDQCNREDSWPLIIGGAP